MRDESMSENGKVNKLSFTYIILCQYFYVDRGGKGEGDQLGEVGGKECGGYS